MSDNPIVNQRAVSTKEVADAIHRSEPQARRILSKLERYGSVKRVGQRGGWIPATLPLIDLYAVAGIPRPNTAGAATDNSRRSGRDAHNIAQRAARSLRCSRDDSDVLQSAYDAPAGTQGQAIAHRCPVECEPKHHGQNGIEK